MRFREVWSPGDGLRSAGPPHLKLLLRRHPFAKPCFGAWACVPPCFPNPGSTREPRDDGSPMPRGSIPGAAGLWGNSKVESASFPRRLQHFCPGSWVPEQYHHGMGHTPGSAAGCFWFHISSC